MKNNLDKLEITGLHASRNLIIPIKDNRLILVGENGSGKSTVAYILYYTLTKQWERLSNYSFKEITLFMNNESIKIFPDYFRTSSVSSMGKGKLESLILEFLNKMNVSANEVILNDHLFMKLRNRLKLFYGNAPPSDYLYRRLQSISGSLSSYDTMDYSEKLKEIESFIDNHFDCAILFLPTYRRIEQDIRSLYPDLANELRRLNEDYDLQAKDRKHVELVKFGMQDVETMINKTMIYFKDNFRSNLENLMGTYLKDILQKKHKAIDIEEIKQIGKKLDTTLQRIDENILSKGDKELLRKTINETIARGSVYLDDYVITHFLSKLIEINENQSDSEKKVREFVQVCNSYLEDPGDRLQMEYDNVKFTVDVKIKDRILDRNVNRKIKFNDLSSGEKQIVSLFCHLYLSNRDKYFIIIDEPELSLSVPWQKKILPDIINSGKCDGLLAVTHSPFVYDNDLDPYTHSIKEFLKD